MGNKPSSEMMTPVKSVLDDIKDTMNNAEKRAEKRVAENSDLKAAQKRTNDIKEREKQALLDELEQELNEMEERRAMEKELEKMVDKTTAMKHIQEKAKKRDLLYEHIEKYRKKFLGDKKF